MCPRSAQAAAQPGRTRRDRRPGELAGGVDHVGRHATGGGVGGGQSPALAGGVLVISACLRPHRGELALDRRVRRHPATLQLRQTALHSGVPHQRVKAGAGAFSTTIRRASSRARRAVPSCVAATDPAMGELPSPTRHRYGRRSLSVGSNRAMVHAVEARAATASPSPSRRSRPGHHRGGLGQHRAPGRCSGTTTVTARRGRERSPAIGRDGDAGGFSAVRRSRCRA
jgi:hypothetical protein